MDVWNKATLKSLLAPGGVLLLAVAIVVHSGLLTLAWPAISFLYYAAVAGGLLLAWRFHSSRVFFALLVMFLAQQAIAVFSDGRFAVGSPGWTAVNAAALLAPLNFVLIALMQERGFTIASTAPVGLFLFVQSVIVAVLCGAEQQTTALSSRPAHHLAGLAPLPWYALAAFVATGAFLLVRFLVSRRPVDSALLWSLSAFFLALRFIATGRTSTMYSAAAAVILAASIIENSYLLAYHDELTTLPSRRAFNDALLRLQAPYSIAVVDIDHFKGFNDTHGHDVGDQVLRLVASHLACVTGGGQAYRCGGEEFSIIFPGKTTAEVIDHLEQLRRAIESAEFRVRGGDRREIARGPERRNERSHGRSRKGDAIRQLAEAKPSVPLSVSVSIGVATSGKEKPDPEQVIQAADKALYRAKANGRNRLETASAPRRTRVKTAGIA